MNNLPRQKLYEIIKMYGKDACNDPKRIRGLLNDFCSGNYPEINFLLMALEEQTYKELTVSPKTVSYEMLSARLIQRLYTNRGMAEEVARWAVDSWALALSVIAVEPSYSKLSGPINVHQANPLYTATSYPHVSSPQTIIVSKSGGQYTSISDAIRNATPNSLILIKPGYYYEGLIIDKRIKIAGDGPREQIVIESHYSSCIEMRIDDEAVIQGLTLRSCASRSRQEKHAIDIPRGRLKVLECDITSDTSACIAIRGFATRPNIQRCRLYSAAKSGLFFVGDAQGVIENCDIFGNCLSNISIMYGANPTIKGCRIYGGKQYGIFVSKNGTGTIENCDIFENAREGVKTKEGGAPVVRRCCVYNNGHQETWVYQNGMGNSSFPRAKVPQGTQYQRNYPEYRSEPIPIGTRPTTEYASQQQQSVDQQGMAHQQAVAYQQMIRHYQEIPYQPQKTQQLEKRQNFFDRILFSLRSIGFNREK